MSKVCPPLFLSFFLFGITWAEEPVHFGDPNLKAAVENELWISDPTATNLLGLTSLYAGSLEIEDLTGLEYATNLQTLWLRFNRISDISLLSGLTNLEYLVLHKNPVSDLSPLVGLTNLYHLNLDDTHVSDISPLASLTNLRELNLFRNQVQDISPLLALTSLEWLDLRENPLDEEAYNIHAPQIRANNPGIDLKHDRGPYYLTISSGPGGSVIQPGEGEFICDDGNPVLIEAKADPLFTFAAFSGTWSSTHNPTYLKMGHDQEIHANFVSVLQVLQVDEDAPGDPGPGDPMRSDPLENGTPEHPFDRIQEALEVAAQGASILVQPGTYRENLDLLGKNIHLLGTDPNDPNRAAYPVLEGSASAPAVRFASGEGRDCTLTGFVITRGKAQPAAALLCHEASPTITNCLIVGNRASGASGAAIRCVRSSAAFRNCTIADNYGGPQGAGLLLVDSSIGMMNSIIWGNSPNEILALGDSAASIRYSDVRGGWLDVANLDVEPLFARPGVWANPKDPNEILAPQDERATWTEGDYHLKSQSGRWDPALGQWVQDAVSSPCLDRGDPASPVEHEPAPNGGLINLGAYGATTQASKGDERAISP